MVKYLKAGQNFSFPKSFGFSHSGTSKIGGAPKIHAPSIPKLAKGGKMPAESPVPGNAPLDAFAKKHAKTKVSAHDAARAMIAGVMLGKKLGAMQGQGGAPGGGAPPPMPPRGGALSAGMPGGAAPPPMPPAMAGKPPGMAKGGHVKNFIGKAIKKPGQLHRDLHVPQGEPIPASKLAAAAKGSGKVAQRARFAETLKGMSKHKKG